MKEKMKARGWKLDTTYVIIWSHVGRMKDWMY